MSDLFAIEGKHVLVTGASSGFGRCRSRRSCTVRAGSRKGKAGLNVLALERGGDAATVPNWAYPERCAQTQRRSAGR
jgi:NAD(P)-dependent dehydrogenase (short-subunit alcohol dehydrogenase family)